MNISGTPLTILGAARDTNMNDIVFYLWRDHSNRRQNNTQQPSSRQCVININVRVRKCNRNWEEEDHHGDQGGFIEKKKKFNLGLEDYVGIFVAINEMTAFQRLGMAAWLLRKPVADLTSVLGRTSPWTCSPDKFSWTGQQYDIISMSAGSLSYRLRVDYLGVLFYPGITTNNCQWKDTDLVHRDHFATHKYTTYLSEFCPQ